MNGIDEWIASKEETLKTWRRELHQIAEVGFCEYETTYYIVQQLAELGFTLHTGQAVMEGDARFGVPNADELAAHEQRARDNGVPADFLAEMSGGFTGVVAVLIREKLVSIRRCALTLMPCRFLKKRMLCTCPRRKAFARAMKG